jgi:hypothetical protein
VVLVAALACSTAALAFAAAGITPLAVAAALSGAMFIGIEVVRISALGPRADHPSAEKFVPHPASAKLAIFDRDTGLFADWYIALRGQEECARAARYDRKFSLLIIEPCAENAAAEWVIKSEIGRWLQTELRATDIAGYLGNGRHIVIAPEADILAVERLIERLHEKVEHVDVGISAFPDDGVTFQQLWRRATARLPQRRSGAA